jgi:inosose dehydratase
MTDLRHRIAGAPITWGVDGSPGWGHLMDPERVLEEMADVGLNATELGPDGYLASDAAALSDRLARFDLQMVGGFVPAVLYRPGMVDDELDYVARAADQLATAGSRVMVLGPAGDQDGYEQRIELDDGQWRTFLANLERLRGIASEEGLTTAVHPHWGMAIERQHHVERLLESCDVGLCLDTGHLYLADADPVTIARRAPDRVKHVHLKDVDAEAAARVRAGDVGFRQAVADGMFPPVGAGDVDIAGVIRVLEANGYDGWYVLEQDQVLTSEPAPNEGPKRDAAASVRYLHDLAVELDEA